MRTPNVLDITDFREKGVALQQAIINAVNDSQRLFIHDLPDELLMTCDQFDMLQTNPAMKGMYDSKEFIYYTPLNAMEVRVKRLL